MTRAKFLRVNVNECAPFTSKIINYREDKFGDLPKYAKEIESGTVPVKEGQVIYKAVGKIVKKPTTKKAKPFEVGKTYTSRFKCADHSKFTVVGKLADGTLVTRRLHSTDGLAFLWKADGSYFTNDSEKLIPEYEEIPGGFTIEEFKE